MDIRKIYKKLNVKLYLILFLILRTSVLEAQFVDSDLKLKITGLSDEVKNLFIENKIDIIKNINSLELTQSLKPMELSVNYSGGIGKIRMTVNYNHNEIYLANPLYVSSAQNYGIYFGEGFCHILGNHLFNVLTDYKEKVSWNKDTYTVNNEIAYFSIEIKYLKSNGDYVTFSDEFYNSSTKSLSKAKIFIGGKSYYTEAINYKVLNQQPYFRLKEIKGLDGNYTGSYYLGKFFELFPNDLNKVSNKEYQISKEKYKASNTLPITSGNIINKVFEKNGTIFIKYSNGESKPVLEGNCYQPTLSKDKSFIIYTWVDGKGITEEKSLEGMTNMVIIMKHDIASKKNITIFEGCNDLYTDLTKICNIGTVLPSFDSQKIYFDGSTNGESFRNVYEINLTTNKVKRFSVGSLNKVEGINKIIVTLEVMKPGVGLFEEDWILNKEGQKISRLN